MTDVKRFERVLLDTGPLVAILTPNDQDHERCVRTLSAIEPPLWTCWAVLTEAAWLLRKDSAAVSLMLQRGTDGIFTILHVSDEELPHIDSLHCRYQSLRPQLADLTLLHLAQREDTDSVFTLDRRDFAVFRIGGRKPLRLLPLVDN